MSAPAAISDLFRVLLPRDCQNGWLAMLSAYFDDSGTHTGGRHGPSKVVLVAGIVGREAQLRDLERNWQRHLDRPLCGQKKPLSRFHMADCQSSRNEFSGWSRTETDYFCHQLQTVLIDSGVTAYGIACLRQDWDELITGDVRGFLGDAESYCISQCFVRALRWAQETTFDPQITFVFDNRTAEIVRRAQAVADAFDRHTQNPQIIGCAFLSSQKIKPLQASDLLAWEFYQHANEILEDGMNPPKRPALRRLHENMTVMAQIARRPAIEKIAAYIRSARNPEFLKAAADHFTNFDPLSPDYSHFSGKLPS